MDIFFANGTADSPLVAAKAVEGAILAKASPAAGEGEEPMFMAMLFASLMVIAGSSDPVEAEHPDVVEDDTTPEESSKAHIAFAEAPTDEAVDASHARTKDTAEPTAPTTGGKLATPDDDKVQVPMRQQAAPNDDAGDDMASSDAHASSQFQSIARRPGGSIEAATTSGDTPAGGGLRIHPVAKGMTDYADIGDESPSSDAQAFSREGRSIAAATAMAGTAEGAEDIPSAGPKNVSSHIEKDSAMRSAEPAHMPSGPPATTAGPPPAPPGFGTAATVPSTAAHATSATSPAPLVEQLSQPLVSQATTFHQHGRLRLQIQLNPPELGRVHILLERQSEQVIATIRLADEQVRAALEQQLPRLLATLDEAGISIDQFHVAADFGDKSQAEQQRGNAAADKSSDTKGEPSEVHRAGTSIIDVLA